MQANFSVLPYKQKEQSPYPKYDNGQDYSPSGFVTSFVVCTGLFLLFAAETLFLGRNLKLTFPGSPVVRLGLLASSAGGIGSNLVQRTKVPYVMWTKKRRKKWGSSVEVE